ncbi:MAG: Na+/H+ antiporter NhaA [Bryobacteraceae bacterium]
MESNRLKVETSTPIVQFARPFQEFAARETSGGILLFIATVAALVWANSAWSESYQALWHTPISISVAGYALEHDLHFLVNDALMAVFFFVVGLEIKRELLVGELASPRQAALPIMAAIGGVLAPALIFSFFNAQGPGSRGWGVPMATDIAFVIGVMALLGDRVPLGLKVFLTALAIVDDIMAVLVIAVFYTSAISLPAVAAAAVCFGVLVLANYLGVRSVLVYGLFGTLLWLAVLQSGIHATIAGVILAIAIPSRTEIDAPRFLRHSRAVLDHFERSVNSEQSVLNDEEQQGAIDALEDTCEKAQPPLHRLIETLHPWVTFVIMPLFALANAGVNLGGDLLASLREPVTLGVLLGLLVGKPLGITAASWLAVKLRLAELPAEIRWSHIHGAGWLGGIGFTMSLFVAALAFGDEDLLGEAKLGILGGSLLAGILGSAFLLRERRPLQQEKS